MAARAIKAILALTLVLALCLPAAAGPVLDGIKKSKEIKVGMDPTYPPLAVRTKTGKIIGFEVDLAGMLASALGVKLKLVPMSFDKLLDALDAGKVDIVLSGMTITASRNSRAFFAGPYLVAGQTVITTDTMAAKLRGMADLNHPDVRVTAAKGTTADMTIKQYLPKANHVPAADQESALKMLLNGKADAVLADYPFARVAAFRYRSKGIVASDKPFTFEPLGIAISEKDPLMANLVQNFLMAIKGSGQSAALQRRWFQAASWMNQLPK